MQDLERNLEIARHQLTCVYIAPRGVPDRAALRPDAKMANGLRIGLGRTMTLHGSRKRERERFRTGRSAEASGDGTELTCASTGE